MRTSQIIILALLGLSFVVGLYQDINGRPAREAEGFGGVMMRLLITAALAYLYWKAGLFSAI